MVLHVDLSPPAPVLGMGLLAGTQLVEVTARWALAGTPVTSFAAPIEIVIPNPSGEPTLPGDVAGRDDLASAADAPERDRSRRARRTVGTATTPASTSSRAT